MEEKNLDSKELLQIRELLLSSNQKRLQALLGFTKTNSCFDNMQFVDSSSQILCPSTPKASILLTQLQIRFSKNEKDRCVGDDTENILNLDETLQALLMIDPMYITPWNALDQFASSLYSKSVSAVSVLQCVSLIEEFLLKTKIRFTDSRKSDGKWVPRCIRGLMVVFAEKLTNHLLSTQNDAHENNSKLLSKTHHETRYPVVTKLTLELLRSVFTICNDWCPDLFDDIVSVTHFCEPPASKIKIWLQLIQLSLSILRYAQIEKIGMILVDLLYGGTVTTLPEHDMPYIISTMVHIASPSVFTSLTTDVESYNKAQKLWRKIMVITLYHTVTLCDQQCYLQTENCLKEGLSKWSVASLKIWISEIIDASTQPAGIIDEYIIPTWFAFNLLLLCTEIVGNEEISSNAGLMVTIIGNDPLDSKHHVNIMTTKEYQLILNFVVGRERKNFLNSEIDKIFYCKNGTFYLENDDEKECDWLTRCGCLIFRSIHLKECPTSDKLMKKTKNALSRAIRLVKMADHILMRCPDEYMLQASIFTVIVKTVAYFEVQEFQIILEGKIKQWISKHSRFQNCHFCTLRLIVFSALKIGNDDEMAGKWIGIIDRNIPFSNITYLNRILTILPFSRSNILNISKKLLAPLYSSWGEYEYEIGTSEHVFEVEIQQRIIGGVRGLLELIRSDRWGENETLAWIILSDLIVKDLPPLPISSRKWLFQALATCVGDGMFDSKTVNLLLRASTTRMSVFFASYETESKALVSTKEKEEIGPLHRLLSVLFRYLANVDRYSKDRYIILAQGREAFLRTIVSFKKYQCGRSQYFNGILNQHRKIHGRDPDTFILCWIVFLRTNFYLLDNMIPEGSTHKIHGHLESSYSNDQASLSELMQTIKEIDNQELQIEYCAIRDFTSIISSRERTQTIASLDEFPCGDLLLEFLFLVPLPPRISQNLDDPLSHKVVIATGFLMSREYMYTDPKGSILSIETIQKTVEPFLAISSNLIRGAIDHDCNLSTFSDLLVPIVSYCEALHSALEKATDVPYCVRIVINIWNLYQAVACEKACVKVIKYLESQISESNAGFAPGDDNIFSLGYIHSERDIDKTVQKLRYSCLQPFLRCMSFLSNTEGAETILPRNLVGGMLGALVSDLQAGLNGRSGGVPKQLYIIYCKAIEECGSLLFHERELSFDYSTFLLFKEVTSTLANILFTVSLRDAILFRTTFILAVAVFPSMCRDLVRKSLCSPDSSPRNIGKMLLSDSFLFDGVLEDCIDILVRWAALREPCLIPWLDIAGPEHSTMKIDPSLSTIDYHNLSDNFGEQGNKGEIPRFVHVPSVTRNCQKSDSRSKRIPGKIRFYTKELWSWALSCSLLGLEQKWLESERTIHVLDIMGNRDRYRISSIGCKEFYFARKSELQNSLLQINRFFCTSHGLQQIDQSGNQILLDMMAMNLPSAPRLRFCSLIECVSRILIHSIRRLDMVCRDANSSDQDISTFESACCLSAWLFLKEHPEKDYSVGVFKWLAIASRKHTPGETNSTRNCDKAKLFKRISQVSKQVHRLYLVLKEFKKSLVHHGDGGESRLQSELIRSFFGGKDLTKEILRFSALKLHSLEQVIPSDFRVKSFPDFPLSKNQMDPGNLRRKRIRTEKRETVSQSRRKKTQNKNRNRVVDIFMNLDEAANSPRYSKTRDAYADLEDFLVEG